MNALSILVAFLIFEPVQSYGQIENEYVGLKFELLTTANGKMKSINEATIKSSDLAKIKYRFTVTDSSTVPIVLDSFPVVLNEYEGSMFFFKVQKLFVIFPIVQCDFEQPLRKVVLSIKPGKVKLKPGGTYKMPDAMSTPYFKNLAPGEYWVQAKYKKPLSDGNGYYLQVSDNKVHFFVKK